MEPELNYPKFYRGEYLEAVYIVKTRQKEEKAKELIRENATGEVGVAVSGKDSLVVLSLTTAVKEGVVAVISTYFIDRKIPTETIEELVKIAKKFTNNIILYEEKWNVHAGLFKTIAKKYKFNTIISGLRRKENGPHWTVERYNTMMLLNPIIHWTATDIWAYLYHYRIPVPRVYREAPFPWTRLQELLAF